MNSTDTIDTCTYADGFSRGMIASLALAVLILILTPCSIFF